MSAISKQFIDFTSEIISDNYSIDMDDIKSKLSTKENKEKFAIFIKSNKIKQKKDKKDKNENDEPEKFKTAYNLFSKDYRQNLVDENPGISIGETASLLGKKWEELKEKTPEIYNKYVDESNRQKDEYEEKMIQYRIDNNLPEKIKKVKKPKESATGGDKNNADGKSKNPFYYFLKENSVIVKNENPKMTQHNIYLQLREKWHESKRNKDDIFLKYKEIAKEKKNQTQTEAEPVSAPSSDENDNSPAPSTPVQTRNSPSPQSSPEDSPSPIKMKTPSPKKKSRMLSPGGLSPSKYLTSPPVVESSMKKKSKKAKVSKEKKTQKDDGKDKKKKKKKKMIEVTDSSSSESDSE